MLTKIDFLTANITLAEPKGQTGAVLLLIPKEAKGRFGLMYTAEKEVIQRRTSILCKKYKPKKVLEVGFGLGYTATELQKNNIEKHTIVEAHSTIFKDAEKWAEKYSNVKLINKFIQDYKYNEEDYDFILDDRLEIVYEKDVRDITPRYKVNNKWYPFFTKEDKKEMKRLFAEGY